MLHENPVVAQLPPPSSLKAIDPVLVPSRPAVGKSALALNAKPLIGVPAPLPNVARPFHEAASGKRGDVDRRAVDRARDPVMRAVERGADLVEADLDVAAVAPSRRSRPIPRRRGSTVDARVERAAAPSAGG